MRMPALGMRQRQPTDEARQFAVSSRPSNKMPVVRHQAVDEQPRLKPRHSLSKYLLERFIVSVVIEDRHPSIRAIQHVINITPLSGPVRSSHG